MNVLILTPDAVGSTLLQRLITIYMNFHKYDKPVINLHELTNGLVKYYNNSLKQEVLGKQEGQWGYHQSLEQIVNLLGSTDHYKTSRLAHYHIKNRQDTIEDQIPFYQYLNENFYIISCRRHNIFEHALSWCLSKITKKLNVYTADEKVGAFFDLYKNGIELDPNSLIQTLNSYRDYISWCNNHFNIANYFYYEEHLPRVENYILNLPIFSQQSKLTWKDQFDIEFDVWNQCHRIPSDLGTLSLTSPEIFTQLTYNPENHLKDAQHILFLSSYKSVSDPSWPDITSVDEYAQLPDAIRKEVEKVHGIIPPADITLPVAIEQTVLNLLPDSYKNFFNANKHNYQNSIDKMHDMINSGILVSTPPIKKQTLAEKKYLIKNYSYLIEVYNQWIESNPELGNPINQEILDQFAQIELNNWNLSNLENQLSVDKKTD